jgi:muramoyltetrapeptide carboxypeptidase LdcA involved in peptidoglycan recycling
MLKPKKLSAGDKIATVSLSWGAAGDDNIRWRYEIGVQRLEKEFQLQVVSMPSSMKGSDFLYKNPKARADDLMQAFEDKSIKAIISNIGGNDSIRILPYVDIDVIRRNPKIFIGYSDVVTIHYLCYKAGLSSFYGPNLLTSISENGGLHPYTNHWLKKVLFCDEVIGDIPPSQEWTNEGDDITDRAKQDIRRNYYSNSGYELLQGSGIVTGHLLGGTAEWTLYSSGTQAEIPLEDWTGSIIFLEDIVECVSPDDLIGLLRWYGTSGILERANGLLFGKFDCYLENQNYKKVILHVIREELGLSDFPILYNMNFGHTSPVCLLPYGAKAEIDCENVRFSILESGVVK